jgi:hypothetical protein
MDPEPIQTNSDVFGSLADEADRAAQVCPLPEVTRTLRVFGPRTDIEEGGGWSTLDWTRPHEVVD